MRKLVYFLICLAALTNVSLSQFVGSCFNSPCQNGGFCVTTSSTTAQCICTGTGYEGNYCQTRTLKYKIKS